MKFELLAAATAAFLTASSHAAPSPDMLQLELSMNIIESATTAAQNVLLVFVGNQPARLGNFYSVNATLDGTPFTIEDKIDVWSVSQYFYGNCTVNTNDGRSFSLINYGIKSPVVQTVGPPKPFVGGSCSPPFTGSNQ